MLSRHHPSRCVPSLALLTSSATRMRHSSCLHLKNLRVCEHGRCQLRCRFPVSSFPLLCFRCRPAKRLIQEPIWLVFPLASLTHKLTCSNRTKGRNTRSRGQDTAHQPVPRTRIGPLFARPGPNPTPSTYVPDRHQPYHDHPHTVPVEASARSGTQTPDEESQITGPTAAGRSGIDGITFPWAASARKVFLAEREWEETRRRLEARGGGRDWELRCRERESSLHRMKRDLQGQLRRDRRRWWDVHFEHDRVNNTVRERQGDVGIVEDGASHQSDEVSGLMARVWGDQLICD
jgi:hypothetical protein